MTAGGPGRKPGLTPQGMGAVNGQPQEDARPTCREQLQPGRQSQRGLSSRNRQVLGTLLSRLKEQVTVHPFRGHSDQECNMEVPKQVPKI